MFGDCLTDPAWHNMDERFSETTSINVDKNFKFIKFTVNA